MIFTCIFIYLKADKSIRVKEKKTVNNVAGHLFHSIVITTSSRQIVQFIGDILKNNLHTVSYCLHNCCPSVLDTVGWVIRPVKIVPDMTYNVFGGMLNPTLHYCTIESRDVCVSSRARVVTYQQEQLLTSASHTLLSLTSTCAAMLEFRFFSYFRFLYINCDFFLVLLSNGEETSLALLIVQILVN